MPELAVERGPLMRLSPGDLDQVWRDPGGAPQAWSYRLNGANVLRIPRLAAFFFESAGVGHVRATPESDDIPEDALRDSFRRCVVPLVLQARGHEVLHASAVRTHAGISVFCAASGTGKSTLACALARERYPLWADDAVALDFSGPEARCVALPFWPRLRPDAARLMGWVAPGGMAAGEGGDLVPRDEDPSTERLGSVYFLSRSDVRAPGRPAEVIPLLPARAFQLLLANAFCFTLADRERNRLMVERYLDVSASVPSYEVRFRPGLGELGDVLRCLTESLGEPPVVR